MCASFGFPVLFSRLNVRLLGQTLNKVTIFLVTFAQVSRPMRFLRAVDGQCTPRSNKILGHQVWSASRSDSVLVGVWLWVLCTAGIVVVYCNLTTVLKYGHRADAYAQYAFIPCSNDDSSLSHCC